MAATKGRWHCARRQASPTKRCGSDGYLDGGGHVPGLHLGGTAGQRQRACRCGELCDERATIKHPRRVSGRTLVVPQPETAPEVLEWLLLQNRMGHVLIAGGERPLVKALRASSQLAGHQITVCRDEAEAVRLAAASPVDVLITDPAASLDDDLSLAADIKALRPDVRTIVLAPALTNTQVLESIRAQVFACFSEPFEAADVAEMTRSALGASEWRDGIEVVSGLPNWLTLRVTCRLLTADRLTRFMSEWRADVPLDERDLLMTAFREVLLNAMEHGAGFDPQKVIKVTAARTARSIVFHFLDPGAGFDHEDLRHAAQSCDPTDVQSVTDHRADTGLRPGGFGMLIVRQVVDELVYNEKGNEVLMIKHTDKGSGP